MNSKATTASDEFLLMQNKYMSTDDKNQNLLWECEAKPWCMYEYLNKFHFVFLDSKNLACDSYLISGITMKERKTLHVFSVNHI